MSGWLGQEGDWPKNLMEKTGNYREGRALLCAHEVDVRLGRLIVRRHVGPVLGVMVGVDEGEHRTVHVSIFRLTGGVEEIKFHRLSVQRKFSYHAGAVFPAIAIMS